MPAPVLPPVHAFWATGIADHGVGTGTRPTSGRSAIQKLPAMDQALCLPDHLYCLLIHHGFRRIVLGELDKVVKLLCKQRSVHHSDHYIRTKAAADTASLQIRAGQSQVLCLRGRSAISALCVHHCYLWECDGDAENALESVGTQDE